ncbi:MAG: hypothetical protein ACI94Y_000644 [Maribacter sp.]|jgi:hypothetical protein
MKRYQNYLLAFVLGAAMMASCNTDNGPALKPLNLLSYGFPITIMAPDSAKVEKSLGGIIEELTITGDGNYGVLVRSSMASITDVAKIKADELKMTKEYRYFSKILQEDPAGFLYETAIDSTNISYEFLYIKVQGDKEYQFRTPYTGSFTEKEAKRIYESLSAPTK